MKKTLKKVVTLLMVLSMMTPIQVMADTNTQEQAVTKTARAEYIETYDQDISLYVSQIDDTMYAHLYFMYSYEEDSWSYILQLSSQEPKLSNIRTGTGHARPVEVQGNVNNNVVNFNVLLSSSSGVAWVTVRAVVDNFGDVSVFIN